MPTTTVPADAHDPEDSLAQLLSDLAAQGCACDREAGYVCFGCRSEQFLARTVAVA